MAGSRMTRILGRWLGVTGYMIQYGCIAHCTLEFVADFVVCKGPSMEPTIYSEDVILTEHITPRLNRIRRGDIIIARSPSNPRQHICKRVTGLEGDKVKNGFATYIDGAPPHWKLTVRAYLNENLPERWIGRGGEVDNLLLKWPPRSPDLT
ncbi:mitochondrial inner membrane protease subunit 1-like isoform X2 [Oratosquilla oratoria]|uniref:mitochondrial inner membrane protease subunit 1-like isoform X2 n=1 Tax=Oratosquilla oratoria TaxID=337810 RepID=UPI003F77289E